MTYFPIPEIFYIYTTGIINSNLLIKEWNNGISKNLIKRIPEKFNIAFIHYDPLLKIDNDKRENYKNTLFNELTLKDYNLDFRVVLCQFIDKSIETNLYYPNIIINFNKILDMKLNHFKILNLSFILENKIGIFIAKSEIIKISDQNEIKLYTDLIKDDKELLQIYYKILDKIDNMIKELKGERLELNTQKIINKLFYFLWEKYDINNIVQNTSNFIIQENLNSIIKN